MPGLSCGGSLVLCVVLTRCASVFLHLKAILKPVCLDRLVIFLMFGDVKDLCFNIQIQEIYEKFYIHSLHKNGKLIPEQSPGNSNPLLDLTIQPPQLCARGQLCFEYPMEILHASRFWQPSAATGMYFINLQTKSHLHTTTEANTHSTPHDNHEQTYIRLRKITKTNENIIPHTINLLEFNTANCYSSIIHTAITPLSRQLLMMGMEFPETCWAVYKVTSSWFCYLNWIGYIYPYWQGNQVYR